MAISMLLWGITTLATYYLSILFIATVQKDLHFRALAAFGASVICMFLSLLFCFFLLCPPKRKPPARLARIVAIVTIGSLLYVITSMVMIAIKT